MTMTDSLAPLGVTQWVPQQSARIEGRRVSVPRPIWHLAVGWVLVIPMLFLAANGGIPGSTSSSSHTIGVALMAMMFLGVIITRKAPLSSKPPWIQVGTVPTVPGNCFQRVVGATSEESCQRYDSVVVYRFYDLHCL